MNNHPAGGRGNEDPSKGYQGYIAWVLQYMDSF